MMLLFLNLIRRVDIVSNIQLARTIEVVFYIIYLSAAILLVKNKRLKQLFQLITCSLLGVSLELFSVYVFKTYNYYSHFFVNIGDASASKSVPLSMIMAANNKRFHVQDNNNRRFWFSLVNYLEGLVAFIIVVAVYAASSRFLWSDWLVIYFAVWVKLYCVNVHGILYWYFPRPTLASCCSFDFNVSHVIVWCYFTKEENIAWSLKI